MHYKKQHLCTQQKWHLLFWADAAIPHTDFPLPRLQGWSTPPPQGHAGHPGRRDVHRQAIWGGERTRRLNTIKKIITRDSSGQKVGGRDSELTAQHWWWWSSPWWGSQRSWRLQTCLWRWPSSPQRSLLGKGWSPEHCSPEAVNIYVNINHCKIQSWDNTRQKVKSSSGLFASVYSLKYLTSQAYHGSRCLLLTLGGANELNFTEELQNIKENCSVFRSDDTSQH